MFDLLIERLNTIDTDRFVLAQNLIWVFFSFAVVVFFWSQMRNTKIGDWPSAYRVLVGIMIVAFFSGLHRVYWSAWRWFRSHDYPQTAELFVDYGWITALPVLGICIGYIFHLQPLLKNMLGKWWLSISLALGGAIFFIGLIVL